MSTPNGIRYRLDSFLLAFLLVCFSGSVFAESFDFEHAPPLVDDATLTALSSTQGNALLDVFYSANQSLPDQIPFNVNDKPVLLGRDPNKPQHYSATINFDFDGFVEEQSERQALAGRQYESPVFAGRDFLGSKLLQFLDPATLRTSIERRVPIHILPGVVTGTPTPVSAAQSLMITDPAVVGDPTRTFDACTGAGNPTGAWTFDRLITNMANQALTGVDPADFVENWLKTWNTPTTINGFPVPARLSGVTPVMDVQVRNTWPRLASGKLDLKRSPLRLLAIVNRLDLRTNAGYGGGTAGEGRFVFGVLRKSGSSCVALPFTVILEYGIPLRGCPAVQNFGQQWANLGGFALGSGVYNAALQAITDQFTAANAAPAKPNGSAINQIRTNDILINPWELREFNVLAASNQLAIVSPKQTPHTSFHNTAALASYINDPIIQPQILLDRHVVPIAMMGGNVPNPSPQVTWQAPGIGNNTARHHFAVNTCDACHGRETATTSFLHVAPRNAGVPSVLSNFLLGTGTLASPNALFSVPDPVDSTPRLYGDLFRRQADLNALISNACPSGGVVGALSFSPISASD